eukprot:g2923.t1
MVREIKPVRFCAMVVKGFNRGSKELGWPTANLENTAAVAKTLQTMDTGIYCGWCTVGPPSKNLTVYKAAISVGHNPTFKGKDATPHMMIEPYILHDFPEDFYNEMIRLVVVGYIRPEADFSKEPDFMAALKAAIANDVKVTDEEMNSECFGAFEHDEFLFTATPENYANSVESKM